MDNKDYDAMFRQSQQNPFRKPEEQQTQSDFMLQRQQREQHRETVTPQVLDAAGRPVNDRSRSGLSPELCGIISLIIGAVSFILIFLGMFFHFFMWLNILLCLVGIGRHRLWHCRAAEKHSRADSRYNRYCRLSV